MVGVASITMDIEDKNKVCILGFDFIRRGSFVDTRSTEKVRGV